MGIEDQRGIKDQQFADRAAGNDSTNQNYVNRTGNPNSSYGSSGNGTGDGESGGLGGYGGYGGGGGGGSSSPSEQQKKAAENLGGITNWNQDTILGAAKNADKVFDISDKQNENLKNIQVKQARRNAGNDWYTQQQRLQSVAANLRESMGNAMYGSTLYDFWDLLARKDDMDDVEVLNTMRENINNVDNEYWQALMATNNSRNESYLDTEQNLRELASDYAAQLNNIHPDLAEDVINGPGEYDGEYIIPSSMKELQESRSEEYRKNLANPSASKQEESNRKDGGYITPPSWLQTSYFDEHVREALMPTEQGLFRPDTAATEAWANGLLTGQKNSSSSTNQSYWQRMFGGYNRRTQ